jgi:alpha-tubulin suppressor-like RCC1 family protein
MIRRFTISLAACATAAVLVSCNDIAAPDETARNTPAPVIGNKTFVDLALGDFHSCALQANGEAFCWGVNSQGQSANGITGDETTSLPLVVLGGFIFSSLTAGGSHTCGIQTSGVPVCWGNNQGGQLGVGNTVARAEPTPIVGQLAFIQLSASTFAHTCGILGNGDAYCWGFGELGRLGDGTAAQRNSPALVVGGIAFTSITAGGGHSCGLTANGTAYCWGYNEHGQVGDGTNANRPSPVTVATTLKFKQIAAGLTHTCALDLQGNPYCWGDNVAAALGDGSLINKNSPVSVENGPNFTTITVGERHTCGLTVEGIVQCWGYNAFGALGDGTFVEVRTAPVLLSTATPLLFKKIAAGAYHTCGITTSNVTYCWGDNSLSQLGIAETP